MISGVYAIYQASRERYVYVGSSNDIQRRTNDHNRRLRGSYHINPCLQRTLDKYGQVDFFFVGVEQCPENELVKREQYWMDTLKPTCNIALYADSPRRGRKASVETRLKLRNSHLGQTAWNKGKSGPSLSEVTRKKLSDAMMGHPPTPGMTGKNHSAITIKKMSAARKRYWAQKRSQKKE